MGLLLKITYLWVVCLPILLYGDANANSLSCIQDAEVHRPKLVFSMVNVPWVTTG